MCDFAEKDVLIIAKTIIENEMDYYDGDRGATWSCNYCYGRSTKTLEDFKHDLGCPSLVARDILTGHEVL